MREICRASSDQNCEQRPKARRKRNAQTSSSAKSRRRRRTVRVARRASFAAASAFTRLRPSMARRPLFARGRELLRGEAEDLLRLPVPVRPAVRAGQLTELVRDFLLDEERGEVAAVRDEEVFRAAVEVKVREGLDRFGRKLARDAEDVVGAAHFASGGAVDARD